MIYPRWLRPGDTVGVTAPSAGIREEKLEAFDLSLEQIRKAGYRVKETASVRSGLLASAPAARRAAELEMLAAAPEVALILCAAGGEFLYGMLPHVNFETLKTHPKWIQGYSDPTGLLYSVTTGLDIATIYGGNGGTFGMKRLHPSLEENLALWRGELTGQRSYDRFEAEHEEGADGYCLTEPVVWETPNGPVDAGGRLIGGCMDCLLDLMGTPFDRTGDFVRRYREEGILWYFDIFSMSAESVYRTLLHMKYCGWFEGAKGFFFGRVAFPQTLVGMTYADAVLHALGGAPVVLEGDVGHVPPRMTFVNGCLAHLRADGGKGTIDYAWAG